MIKTTAIVVALLVSGCAMEQPQWQKDLNASIKAAREQPSVSVKSDQFERNIEFTGPSSSVDLVDGSIGWVRWNVRSWMGKESRAVTHQLYVEALYYGSFRGYWVASDDQANPLDVTAITSGVGSCHGPGDCSISEVVGIDLDGVDLEEKVKTGYPIKIKAQSGAETIIKISPQQIEMQLAAIKKARAEK